MDLPQNLLEEFKKGDVILFCGAGISVSENGLPDSRQLAKELAERGNLSDVDGWSLPLVAQMYELRNDRPSLLRYIMDRFYQSRYRPPLTHRLIAALPLKKFITTNWDTLLEDALRLREERCNILTRDTGLGLPGQEGIWLIKLHGSIDQPETIVVTENDYHQVFNSLPQTMTLIKGLLSTHTFLFLGFSLADEDFRRLYHEVAGNLTPERKNYMRRAYAVQHHPHPLMRDYWDRMNVEIIAADACAFLEAITERLYGSDALKQVKEQVQSYAPLPPRNDQMHVPLESSFLSSPTRSPVETTNPLEPEEPAEVAPPLGTNDLEPGSESQESGVAFNAWREPEGTLFPPPDLIRPEEETHSAQTSEPEAEEETHFQAAEPPKIMSEARANEAEPGSSTSELDAEPWVKRGGRFLLVQAYEEALKAYRQAIQIDSRCAQAHTGVGLALKYQGHLLEAREALQKAVDNDPKLVLALWSLAEVLRDLKLHAEAGVLYKKAQRAGSGKKPSSGKAQRAGSRNKNQPAS